MLAQLIYVDDSLNAIDTYEETDWFTHSTLFPLHSTTMQATLLNNNLLITLPSSIQSSRFTTTRSLAASDATCVTITAVKDAENVALNPFLLHYIIPYASIIKLMEAGRQLLHFVAVFLKHIKYINT